MSRIGKKPISLPSGVTLNVKNRLIEVKGPKGVLTQNIPEGVSIVIEKGEVFVHRRDDSKVQRSYHGLVRSLLYNMTIGVTQGFRKQLDLVGIGYKAEVVGNKLTMSLGYSHPVEYIIPDDVQVKVEKTKKKISGFVGTIYVEGNDKQLVGQVTAEIRAIRKPDAYKGKGLRYSDEVIRLKEGKKTA